MRDGNVINSKPMLLVPMITGIKDAAIEIAKKVTNKNSFVKNMMIESKSKTPMI